MVSYHNTSQPVIQAPRKAPCLHRLNVPPNLPVRNGLIPQPNLMLPRPPKVVDKGIAKHLPCDTLLAHEALRSLLQRLCKALALVRLAADILALAERGDGNLHLLLDAAPAEGQDGSEDKVRVCVCAGDADLEAGCLCGGGGGCNEADGGGAVLEAPGDGDGGPEVFDEPLVRVDVGGQDGHDVWQAVDEAGEEVPAQVAEEGNVAVGGRRVFGLAGEEVGAVVVD